MSTPVKMVLILLGVLAGVVALVIINIVIRGVC